VTQSSLAGREQLACAHASAPALRGITRALGPRPPSTVPVSSKTIVRRDDILSSWPVVANRTARQPLRPLPRVRCTRATRARSDQQINWFKARSIARSISTSGRTPWVRTTSPKVVFEGRFRVTTGALAAYRSAVGTVSCGGTREEAEDNALNETGVDNSEVPEGGPKTEEFLRLLGAHERNLFAYVYALAPNWQDAASPHSAHLTGPVMPCLS
jgi:hypothetical protein